MAVGVLYLILFLLHIIQKFHFLIAASLIQSQMERQLLDISSGFLIDCGVTPGSSYFHSRSRLSVTSDQEYISTGKNMGVSKTYYSEAAEDEPFNNVRSFPEGSRNCYNLHPSQPNKKYLIRAWFMHGNYDGENPDLPAFDLYIGVNFWYTVSIRKPNITEYPEIIHLATTNSIDVCLVNTGQGTPFISALELRPLDDTSPYNASADFSLNMWIHEDVGGPAENPGTFMVNDDVYGRPWYRASERWVFSHVIKNESFVNPKLSLYRVPTTVLITACDQLINSSVADLTFKYTLTNSTAEVYAFWHFLELQLLGSNDTREFNIFVPFDKGYTFGPIVPNSSQLTTVPSPKISLNGSNKFNYTLKKTDKSSLNPILNAFELYIVLNLPVSPTNQVDADAVTAIKNAYQVPRIWQGDPCLPKYYQWEGLNCSYVDNNPPRITSLSLPSCKLTGDLPPSLSNLTSLTYLDLSNNGFTGTIPEFLAYLPSLKSINLTGNNLTGPVPRQLAEMASNKTIELRLARNPYVCNSYPCGEKRRYHFIIPVVTCVALVVSIGIIFLVFRWRKKQEALKDRGIKSKNKRFKSSDIERITGNFKEVIGRGGFATVYYGVLQDDIEVAVKVLNNVSSAFTMKQFRAEAELLTRIHHVNLVSLIGYCDEDAIMALLYEYMCRGNLENQLSERNEHPLSWKARLQISIDAAQGLDYLHCGCHPPIIHRDIKPANILLDEMGHALIADFGLSRVYMDKSLGAVSMTNVAGTRGYLDPEYFQLNTFCEKSDVYAFGIVLLQLLTGQHAFIKDPTNEDRLIYIIHWVSPFVERGDIMAIVDQRLQGDFNVNSAWKFLEIAMECVKPTGDERPRMSEVVVDLKTCYESEGFHEQNLEDGADSGNHYMNSSQTLEYGSLVSLPGPR